VCYGTGALSMPGIIEQLKHFAVGNDPSDIERIWTDMYKGSFWAQGGGPHVTSGISAIEMALWDIVGKALRTPVYKLLGGACQKKIRVYANDWFAILSRRCRTAEDYAREARIVVEEGFTALKFDAFPRGPRLSVEDEQEVLSKYTAVREAVGDKTDILVEVHGKLDTDTAIRIGKKLERLSPMLYEEPIPMDNPNALAKVAREVDIPIAAANAFTRDTASESISRNKL
jgi:galactonate dehydratase